MLKRFSRYFGAQFRAYGWMHIIYLSACRFLLYVIFDTFMGTTQYFHEITTTVPPNNVNILIQRFDLVMTK
jgi:hypothetical protein